MRGIRNARAEAGIDPGELLEARLFLADVATAAAFERLAGSLGPLARARFGLARSRDQLEATGDGLVVVSGANEARVRRRGADLPRERARLGRELEEARRLLDAAEARLANPDFVARAPAPIVDGARARARELRERVAVLMERVGAGR